PVQVGRQGRHQGLALAGLHLRHPAEVQRRPAHDLDVVVALAEDPPGGLPDDGEGLGQEVVEILPVVEAGAEGHGPGRQLVVRQGLDLGLEGPDLGDDSLQRLDLPTFAQVEDLVENSHRESSLPTARHGAVSPADESAGAAPVVTMPRCSPWRWRWRSCWSRAWWAAGRRPVRTSWPTSSGPTSACPTWWPISGPTAGSPGWSSASRSSCSTARA